MTIIFCIVALLLFLVSGYWLYSANQKLQQVDKIESSNAELIQQEEKRLKEIQNEIMQLSYNKANLAEQITKEREKNDNIIMNEKNRISELIYEYQKQAQLSTEQYASTLETYYLKAESEFDTQIQALEDEKEEVKAALKKLQDSLSAGVQAQLREQEKNESLNFYKLKVTKAELKDIEALNQLKMTFCQPVILSKLIWSTFFQKQTTEMCNRILGVNKKCGIYKITNLISQQSYVGQSVDIASRWKDHIKCGLGIDASATNRLYKAMQEDGVWNFTFELLEECPRPDLNEKERFWINLYQTDKFGYNGTAGNK